MWDIFNKRALELAGCEISHLKIELDKANEEIHKLKSQLSGKRVCDMHCFACKHSYEIPTFNPLAPASPIQEYRCKLDIKCKDFEERKQT